MAVSRIIKLSGILVGGILILITLTLLYFTLMAYDPPEVVELENLGRESAAQSATLDSLKVITWNIGYGGLDRESDFVLDGGDMGTARSKKAVEENLGAALSFLISEKAQVYFLQEVDRSSSRSYEINQLNEIVTSMEGYSAWYGINFKAVFVPFPFSDPIRKVHSGVLTLVDQSPLSSERIQLVTERFQLPGEYDWPTRIFHLRRCILISRIPTTIPDRDWCLINLHLSAYDASGILRKKQLDFIRELMIDLYQQGHLVVMGGDWNSQFDGVENEMFGSYNTSPENLAWIQQIPADWTPDKWQWGYDPQVPTVRSLDQPYKANENFKTIIDGFLISPNVEITRVEGTNFNFQNSDHNPVTIWVKAR